ncbi:hypothetical protein C6P40_000893, partial [Pichia californica]
MSSEDNNGGTEPQITSAISKLSVSGTNDKPQSNNSNNSSNSNTDTSDPISDKHELNTSSAEKILIVPSRSRSGSDINSKNVTSNNPLSTSSLRVKLSRNTSSSSLADSAKSKMKLKLQLSQQNPSISMSSLQITPVLLSPRGTPGTSPNVNSEGYFNNFEHFGHVANTSTPSTGNHNQKQQHQMDSILDKSIHDSNQAMKLIVPTKYPSSNSSGTKQIPSSENKSSSENNSNFSKAKIDSSSPQS